MHHLVRALVSEFSIYAFYHSLLMFVHLLMLSEILNSICFPQGKKKDKWSNFKSNFSKYIMHSYFLSELSFLLMCIVYKYIQYICVLEKHSTLIYSSIDEAVDRAWGILITLLKNRYIMHYRCSCCWFGCMLVLNWIPIQ